MVRDLAVPVAVRIVPTMREADGLAMSSRNAYLTPEQRAQAPSLHRALMKLRDQLASGRRKTDAIAAARDVLGPLALPDYLDVVDARTFEPIERLNGEAFVIGAARLGNTRLIDNLHVSANEVRAGR
jgi:pantoate--beta-alanine ligase